MCASWTGRVRREERERGRKTHAHTNALSFFTLCRQHHDTSKDYLLSHLLLTFFLSPCQTGTHSSRPESLTRTHTHSRSYTHSNSRKTNARHHPDFCMRTRTCTPSSTHTRTNQTLLNVCFLEEEPARFSTCLSALKSARVAVVEEAKVRRGGGRLQWPRGPRDSKWQQGLRTQGRRISAAMQQTHSKKGSHTERVYAFLSSA